MRMGPLGVPNLAEESVRVLRLVGQYETEVRTVVDDRAAVVDQCGAQRQHGGIRFEVVGGQCHPGDPDGVVTSVDGPGGGQLVVVLQ